MNYKLTSDHFAVVTPDWKLLDAKAYPPPPKGQMLCGNVHTGKTIISTWDKAYGFTHWAPLPTFPKNT